MRSFLHKLIILYIDMNECSDSNGGCQHNCTNTIGSYYCSCAAGYSLDENDHSCSCEIRYKCIIKIVDCYMRNNQCMM